MHTCRHVSQYEALWASTFFFCFHCQCKHAFVRRMVLVYLNGKHVSHSSCVRARAHERAWKGSVAKLRLTVSLMLSPCCVVSFMRSARWHSHLQVGVQVCMRVTELVEQRKKKWDRGICLRKLGHTLDFLPWTCDIQQSNFHVALVVLNPTELCNVKGE